MEARHSVERPFGSEFPTIYRLISAKLWRPEVAKPGNVLSNFCVFSEKRPLMLKFQNFVRKVYIATPIDVVVWKCRKICPTGNRWNCALFAWPKNKQTFGCLSNCRYCADRAQNLPGTAPNIWLIIFQITSKSVNFRLSYSRTREDRFCRIEYLHANNVFFRPIALQCTMRLTHVVTVSSREELCRQRYCYYAFSWSPYVHPSHTVIVLQYYKRTARRCLSRRRVKSELNHTRYDDTGGSFHF